MPARFASRDKKQPAFVCTSCGHDSNKWYGVCPSCREVDSFKEFKVAGLTRSKVSTSRWIGDASTGIQTTLTPIADVEDASHKRTSFGSEELDRLFGGGMVSGSAVLLAGAPGVGKSTLALQMAGLLCSGTEHGVPYAQHFTGGASASVAHHDKSRHDSARAVAYISGEESAAQVKARATRLGLAHARGLLLLNCTSVEDILMQLDAVLAVDSSSTSSPTTVSSSLCAVVVDSIQTMSCEGVDGTPGSVSQVKEAGLRLSRWARITGVPVLLVGHVTKSGDVAGPRVLEHLVDAVMMVESGEEGLGSGAAGGWGADGSSGGTAHGSSSGSGASSHSHRVVRATKNRFGSTSELGLFIMGDNGFQEALPAAMFLSHSDSESDEDGVIRTEGGSSRSGCAVAVSVEGTRALCVEVQVLVTRCLGAYPRHRAMGVPSDRLHMAWAVLSRHTRFRLAYADVLANVVGGLRLTDTASDLAVAMALASSAADKPLPTRTVYIGELGLGGEVRAPARLQDRLRAASRLGFRQAYIGSAGAGGGSTQWKPVQGLKVMPVRSVGQAIALALGPLPSHTRSGPYGQGFQVDGATKKLPSPRAPPAVPLLPQSGGDGGPLQPLPPPPRGYESVRPYGLDSNDDLELEDYEAQPQTSGSAKSPLSFGNS